MKMNEMNDDSVLRFRILTGIQEPLPGMPYVLEPVHREHLTYSEQPTSGFDYGDWRIDFFYSPPITVVVIRNTKAVGEHYTGIANCMKEDVFEYAVGRQKAFRNLCTYIQVVNDTITNEGNVWCLTARGRMKPTSAILNVAELQEAYGEVYHVWEEHYG